MKIDIENPGLQEINKYKDQWLRVRDFLDFNHQSFNKIETLVQAIGIQSGFYLGLLDYRALSVEKEFIYPISSMAELKEFIIEPEENGNPGNRYPNGQKERMNYYIYNCLFTQSVEMEERKLTPFFPNKEDKWSILGYKHNDMICVKAIVPRCIVSNNAPFCEYEDLAEKTTTDKR